MGSAKDKSLELGTFLVELAFKELLVRIAGNNKLTSEQKIRLIKGCFLFTAISLGLFQAVAYRLTTSSGDSISYLEMAEGMASCDWNRAIIGYWSPFYPFLISIILKILHPSHLREFIVLKVANFLSYLFVLASWEFFFAQFLSYYKTIMNTSSNATFSKISEVWWQAIGSCLFLWAFLCIGGVLKDNPDTLTYAFILLSSGILLRINLRPFSNLDSILLGASLGLGYLSKAVMLPLSFVYVYLSALSSKTVKLFCSRILLIGITFLFMASPWIFAISSKYGHLSFGSPGVALSYDCTTFQLTIINARNNETLRKQLIHPTRRIFDDPEVFEYATPIPGTYPPTLDPGYWNEGLRLNIAPLASLVSLVCNLWFYWHLFVSDIFLGWFILFLFSRRSGISIDGLKPNFLLSLPALAAFVLYSFATNSFLYAGTERYFPAFIILLVLAFLASIRLPKEEKCGKAIKLMLLVISAICLLKVAIQVNKDIEQALNLPNRNYWLVAEQLKLAGVNPGDKMAVLGTPDLLDWAKLAQVQVIAEIPDVEKFWDKDRATQKRILELLRATGAKAVAYFPHPLSKVSAFEQPYMEKSVQQISRLLGQKPAPDRRADRFPLDIGDRGWHKISTVECYIYLF